MSTRFVWGRNNLTAQNGQTKEVGLDGNLRIIVRANVDWRVSGDFSLRFVYPYPVVYTGPSYSISNGKFVVSSATRNTVDDNEDTVAILSVPEGDTETAYFGVSSSGQNSFDYLYRITYTAPGLSGAPLSIRLEPDKSEGAYIRTSMGAVSGLDGSGYSMTIVKGSASGNVSNAASSTYPPCDAAGRITSICAVLPIIRRCRDVQ